LSGFGSLFRSCASAALPQHPLTDSVLSQSTDQGIRKRVPFAFAGLASSASRLAPERNDMNPIRAFLNRRVRRPMRLPARALAAPHCLPRAILKLLANRRWRQELLAIITAIEALSHLSNEERRALAVRALATWLQAHHIPLDEHEINLLVELLVHLTKGR